MLVYVMQVYLYTMTNYSTHFTGADPGFPTRKGWGGGGGGGWYIVMEHALVDQNHVGGSGGGGMQEEGARKIIFILRLWKHYFSSWTLLKMAVQQLISHQSPHMSIILYLSTVI